MASTDQTWRQDMFAETRCAPPCAIVLFGATGDLAARKIAPAIYNLAKAGLLPEHFALVGVARRDRDDEQFRREMREAIARHVSGGIDEDLWRDMSQRWSYLVAHSRKRSGYDELARRLEQVDRKWGTAGGRLFYLSSTPESWPGIATELGRVGLHKSDSEGGFARIVVEKPFGRDMRSAEQLNQALLEVFDESQIFRIDHYLGKETVQNLLVFRFANSIFDPLLSGQYVQRVELSTSETAGMEGRRGPYYEQTGALRDMVQNHMLQLLSLVAMEPPAEMTAEAVRDAKVELLRSIAPIGADEVPSRAVRGQYLGGDQGPAYRQEQGVEADSMTETYAAVKLFIDNSRWSGVPFYLRTGKRLAAKLSYVTVVFRKNAAAGFGPDATCDMTGPNRLVVRISPDEGISLAFDAKVPGPRMLLRPVRMNFGYDTSFGSGTPEAYERLLLDALCGKSALFIRADEVEASWRLIDPIRAAWDGPEAGEMVFYGPGSWGPDTREALFGDLYDQWHNLEPR